MVSSKIHKRRRERLRELEMYEALKFVRNSG